MKKQPEITAQTREKLIEAFWSLYCEKKIEHITIKEITDKAGYHRSTFYEYFMDIYNILEQLEASLLKHIEKNVLASLDVEVGEDFTQNIAKIYDEKGEYLSVLLGENGDPNFLNKIKAIMRPGLTDAFGLSENEIHTSYIFEFATSGILSAVTHWYKNGKDLPSQELVGLVRSMLMGGVFPMIQRYSTTS
jgi:AcrR family transcriptional regulator